MYNFSESLHWGSFLTTVISINIFWWIWDIPLIWKRGFRAYVDAITWECVRLYMPSIAGAFAIYHTANRARWPKLYYFGGRDESLIEGMTDTEVIRIVITDSLTITATVLTISKFYIEPSDSIFNTALWAFPSLQVSLIGIWIVGASYTKTCPIRNILLGGALFVFVIGICVGIILMCSSLTHVQAWLPTTMLYFFMASPFCLYTHGAFVAVIVLMATMARVGGLAITALLPRHAMPSTSIKNPLFGTVYLAVGLVGGILAIYGRLRSRHICMVLKQDGTIPDMNTSMLSNGVASLDVLQTWLRRKCGRKHISEKDGMAVGRTIWPRQSGNYQPIIQPPERAYYSELMVEECTRRSLPVHDSPDVGVWGHISARRIPADEIHVINAPKYSESIESAFFSGRARARSIRIKRKPVGSGSLTTRTTQWRNDDNDKYITNIQKPISVTYQPHNNTNKLSNEAELAQPMKQHLAHSAPLRASSCQQPGNKRRARYSEAGKIHIGTRAWQSSPPVLKSKPLPKPPAAAAATAASPVIRLKNWARGEG
ncbi:conserved hypothetical protein [Histoplasma capsulatum var. duboisii H88]|uniref:Uncharacterized protein n=1 Tax=Ajellomyces capsulatus (strain H88) TaxID=544711 RepID=F0UUS2_AJEC8|nr:conserved hypothetical protein [Histoplasma capsulatum var. duboisii H88]QSS57520.1 hypothetical protein I7I53_11720 [Histoplasma capsulatum var. duboisii H88]